MSPSSNFEEAFKRAVTPGSERLLAGVALAAAGHIGKSMFASFLINLKHDNVRSTKSKHSASTAVTRQAKSIGILFFLVYAHATTESGAFQSRSC